MPETISREELVAILRATDPVAAGRQARELARATTVTYSRRPAPPDWLVDDGREGSLEDHARAHARGDASEAAVVYGHGRAPEAVADRLLGLAELMEASDRLMAVCPVPAEGDTSRPGSWGVEDLSVIAAARLALPRVPWVRPSWRLLGAPACQIAVAFGANDWQLPEDDRTDVEALASAVGVTAVQR
jgi:hypothetical protein